MQDTLKRECFLWKLVHSILSYSHTGQAYTEEGSDVIGFFRTFWSILTFILLALSGIIILDNPLSDAAFFWVLAGAFAIPAVICKVKSYPALRLMQYHRVLADRSSCKVEELAAAVGKPVPQTELHSART